MENKKVTKREYFEMIKGICGDREDIVNFCNREIELLDNKKAKGGSAKNQEQLRAIAEMLIDELTKLGTPKTISDLMASSEVVRNYTYVDGKETKNLTNQKISAIFKQLVDNKELVKVTEKKKSYFSIPE